MLKVRLTEFEIKSIQNIFKNLFLEEDHVWLFGSRTDLTAKGGDIDLYIETNITNLDLILEKKSKFIIDLENKIGEQKIDIVINYKGSDKLAIHKYARQEGILLI